MFHCCPTPHKHYLFIFHSFEIGTQSDTGTFSAGVFADEDGATGNDLEAYFLQGTFTFDKLNVHGSYLSDITKSGAGLPGREIPAYDVMVELLRDDFTFSV